MTTFVKWVFIIGAYGVGLTFLGALIYFVFVHPVYTAWADYKRKRDARDLKSYTVWVKEDNMDSTAIDSVLKLFNSEMIEKRLIKLDEILSITYSPHYQGHQFTMWYKVKQFTTSWWVDFIGEIFSGLRDYNYHGGNSNFDYSKYSKTKYPRL